MIDIVAADDGEDLRTADTDVPRAANYLSVQIGALEYAPEVGIDMAYFIGEQFNFQADSYRSYCIETLAKVGINVSAVLEVINPLFVENKFSLTPNESSGGLLAR